MIRLILLTDFTESFSYNLLKGVLAYSKKHEPWVVCRMPPSYKLTYGIEGVLKWAKAWQADAIIGRFDNDDNVELFRKNGIIAIAQDYKYSQHHRRLPQNRQDGSRVFFKQRIPVLRFLWLP